jgi:Uma2 family endonuclease
MENEVKEPAPKYNYVSPEQYLEMERVSEEKHDYFQGELFTFSGASVEHSVIVKNINTHILPFLKGNPCDMFGSDLRIHIPENTLYTYPDFSIICGKLERAESDKDSIINPSVIIEVLSKSTEDYDRGGKFYLYRSIKTLKEYILIDSLHISAEFYTRQNDNSWILKEFKHLSDNFFISAIGLTLSLKDIYDDVSFDE